MSNKTIQLEEDKHIKLCQIQLDLRKIGINETIQEINNFALEYGINETFEIIKNNKIIKETQKLQNNNKGFIEGF